MEFRSTLVRSVLARAVCLLAALLSVPALSGEFVLEEQQLLASDGLNSDQFGTAVAIDGNFAVVGANGVDRNTNLEGAAYVYRLTPSGWVEDAILQASDIAEGDMFGFAVGISGSRIIVGSPFNDDFGGNTGAAYIFERIGGQWVEQQRIVAADRSDIDQFGQSVAIDGETVLIGSPRDDDFGNDSGSVYVYVRAGGTWTLQQKLTPSDGSAERRFGSMVDVSGDAAAISSTNAQPSGLPPDRNGTAYIFRRDSGTWSEEAQLSPDDLASDDRFGRGLAIDGDTLVVGSWLHQHVPAGGTGAAYVFRFVSGQWVQQAELLSDGGRTSVDPNSVDVSGARAVVGDVLFKRHGGGWSQEGRFELLSPIGDKQLGEGGAVALNGDTALLGQRLYPLDGANWGHGSAWIFSITLGTVLGLPDLNSNGSPDIGIAVPGGARVVIRDGATDDLVSDINLGQDMPYELAVLPDLDASGNPEIALLGEQATGHSRVQIRDTLSSSLVRNLLLGRPYASVAMRVIDDYSGNGLPEIAVMGSDATDVIRVQVQDTGSGATLNNLFLGNQGIGRDFVAVSDTSGNSMPELGVLSVLKGNDQVRTQVWDAVDATFQTNVWFGKVYQPYKLMTMPDINANGSDEAVSIGVDPATGNIRVQVRDSASTATHYNIWLGNTNQAVDIALINDINGNGFPDLAVLLKTPEGTGRVRVQDGLNGAFVRNLFFSAISNPTGLTVMPDYSGNGFDELAALGESAGVRQVQILDSSTGAQVNRIDYP